MTSGSKGNSIKSVVGRYQTHLFSILAYSPDYNE